MKKLGISISHDTILRLIRKLPKHTVTIDDSVKNIGIDDFAFKKRKKYCTLICDMDKRIILDILPSRNKAAVADWLKKYPQIRLVSRDGSISYASAITEALPNALQVSDKFHLVKNLLDNINRYIKRKYPKNLVIPKNKEEIVDAVIEDKNNIKTAIRDEKIRAKCAFIKEIKDKHQFGASIRGLAREYSMSKNTIKEYLKSEKNIYWPQGIKRGSELDKYKSHIVKLLKQCKTHKEILHEISKLGYKGSLSYLSSYMSKNGIKRASVIDIADSSVNTKTNYIINSSLVINAICKNSENLSNTDVDTLRMLSRTYPELIDLKNLIDDFKSIFKGGSLTLETWISKAKDFNVSELSSYISGIENDIASVKNSTSSKYNNGLLEGMVNKVKGIKRTSYGRCNFDLLRSKILHSQGTTG